MNLILQRKYFIKNNMAIRVLIICALLLWSFYCINDLLRKTRSLIHWNKGLESVLIEDYNRAIKEYKQAQEYYGYKGHLLFNLGAAYLNNNEPQLALKYLKKAVQSFMDEQVYVALGFSYIDLSLPEEAFRIFNEYSRKYPNRILPHLLMAKVKIDAGKHADALYHLEKVLSIKPKFDNDYSKLLKLEAQNLKSRIEAKERKL